MQPYDTFLLDSISSLRGRYETFCKQNGGPYYLDVRSKIDGGLFARTINNSPDWKLIEDLVDAYLFDPESQLYLAASEKNRYFQVVAKMRNGMIKYRVLVPIVQEDLQAETTTQVSEEEAKNNPYFANIMKQVLGE